MEPVRDTICRLISKEFFRSSTRKLRVADLLQLPSSSIWRRKVFRSCNNFLDRRKKSLPWLDVRHRRWNLPDRHALSPVYLSTQPQSRLILAFIRFQTILTFVTSSFVPAIFLQQVKSKTVFLHFQAHQPKGNNCIRSYSQNMKNTDPINFNSSFADVKINIYSTTFLKRY